ncbi:MAG: BACON domain-containing protein, partial [Ktedonobacterales bacterium]
VEVLGLVGDLRQAAHRLGDALVAAGLNAREWRGEHARLALLSDQLPDITVDELITRLAEFGAAHGQDWLHGGPADIARFNDEVEVLYGVLRPLRVVAQRLRMIPANKRSAHSLERTLGSAVVGTPLDLVVGALRDLEALSPYLAPLTVAEWNNAPPATIPTNLDNPEYLTHVEAQSFTRLRDFAPTPGTARQVQEASQAGQVSRLFSWLRVKTLHLPISKWIVVATAIVALGTGTLLLSMAARVGSGETIKGTVASQLVASPVPVSLACRGKGTALELQLHNTGKTQLEWSIKTPPGLWLSATQGTLAPGKTTQLQIKVTSAKPEQGTMAFTSGNDLTRIPYTIACS